MGCRLIINADDFGHSDGVNRAIVRAHTAGMLTSCSMMVSEPAVAEAVALAREHPQLAVGLHVTLLRGRPCLSARSVPALLGRGDEFGTNPAAVGMRYYFSPAARQQVWREVEAQFRAFEATGLPLSHVDAHLHFHLHPVIFAAILEIAPRYGCHKIRIPNDVWQLHRRIDRADADRQALIAAIFAVSCRRMRPRAKAAGFRAPDHVFGTFRTGRLNKDYLVHLARMLPNGFHELHCHPDCDTDSGRRELDALLSPPFQEALAARGVTLATYADMEAA